MNPDEVARLIAQASDEQLAEGMRANREAILDGIFASMPARIDPAKTADVQAVVEWRIRDREDGGVDRWQVHIDRGSCRVERDGEAATEVVYEIGAVDFLKLVTGNESGPKLFLFGRLRIHGNLLLAARMPNLFKVPEGGPQ
jgi:putative sterol carrier protein